MKHKRILICPLDWGLGHATRCIPIIRYLLEKDIEVIVGTDKSPLELLKKEFFHHQVGGELTFLRFPGYEIAYPEKGSMQVKILFSIPKILWRIYKEHILLKKIIKEHKIDLVISDNRFGLWNKSVSCIFITHQLMIKSPVAENFLFKINNFFIRKYNECWLPDDAGNDNLSGDLSHLYPLPANTFFIGALSRFNQLAYLPGRQPTTVIMNGVEGQQSTTYDLMVILSGPEPQRTVFEKIIMEQLKNCTLKTLVVRGVPEINEHKTHADNIEVISHLQSEQMQQSILNSKIILARSGYSTIMDLPILAKKAIFVPTPGQTEQEYLAEYHLQNKIAYSISQDKFNLNVALAASQNYLGFVRRPICDEFKKRLELIVNSD